MKGKTRTCRTCGDVLPLTKEHFRHWMSEGSLRVDRHCWPCRKAASRASHERLKRMTPEERERARIPRVPVGPFREFLQAELERRYNYPGGQMDMCHDLKINERRCYAILQGLCRQVSLDIVDRAVLLHPSAILEDLYPPDPCRVCGHRGRRHLNGMCKVCWTRLVWRPRKRRIAEDTAA